MENWIGVGIWIVMGAVIGSFGAVVGGMLGVGIFHFFEPTALSVGGMASAAIFAAFMAWVYRWGIRGLV